MMAMELPNAVASTSRRESFVNVREDDPVPREGGRAAERDVENVF
jgi:hypothetical protein